MKLPWLAPAFAFVAVLSIARAAEPPAEEAKWMTAVSSFAEVLEGKADREALDKLLSDHSWVAPFARNRTEAVGVLPQLMDGMRVVSARGCLQPAVTSATDLVTDISANVAIAEGIRKKLVPTDPQALRQADATMARWFSVALDAQPGEPVALIAMYDEGKLSADGLSRTSPAMTLLLIRGEFLADGSPRISRVLYGTLEAAVR